MSNKYALILLLILSLLSCSSEEECQINNMPGLYTGTYVEKYPLDDEVDMESIESIEVKVEGIDTDSPRLVIGNLDLVFDIVVDGCTFTSEQSIEDDLLVFKVEGSFENDQLLIQMTNPIKYADTEEEVYGGIADLAASGGLQGLSESEVLEALKGLDGIQGLEEIEGIEQLDDIEELLEIVDFMESVAEYATLDLSKL